MTTRDTHASSPLVSVAMLIVAMASVQTGAAIAKRIFPVVGFMGAVALRVLFAALILSIAFRPWRARMSRATWKSVLIYGVSLGGMNVLFYAALRTVPLGIATALEFTGPLAVAISASRRAIDFLWIALAVAGLAILLPLGQTAGGIDPIGGLYALGAGVFWALYIMFGQKAGAEHGLRTTAVGMAVAALVVLPFGLADAEAAIVAPRILPAAFAIAVLSSALPYSLEMYALPRLPTKTFGTLMSIEPAFGAVAGLAFLGEHLTTMQWLAITSIIAASVGTTLGAAQSRRPAPQGADPTVGDLAGDEERGP